MPIKPVYTWTGHAFEDFRIGCNYKRWNLYYVIAVTINYKLASIVWGYSQMSEKIFIGIDKNPDLIQKWFIRRHHMVYDRPAIVVKNWG